MSPDDMQRFELGVLYGGEYGTDQILITCERCGWDAELDTAEHPTLAELVQRADEHTEVCR